MLINDRCFKIFVSSLSCVQNPYVQIHHFGGVKSAALTFYSTPQTVAISQLNQWHVVSIPQYMCRSRPTSQNGYFQTNRVCIFVGLADCEAD